MQETGQSNYISAHGRTRQTQKLWRRKYPTTEENETAEKKVSSQVKINNSACSSSVLCLIVRVRACTQSETKCISAPTLLALLPLAALYRHKRHCAHDCWLPVSGSQTSSCVLYEASKVGMIAGSLYGAVGLPPAFSAKLARQATAGTSPVQAILGSKVILRHARLVVASHIGPGAVLEDESARHLQLYRADRVRSGWGGCEGDQRDH